MAGEVYKGGAVEIVFIGGLADWFTVYPANAPFTRSGLTQLGLPADKRPSFKSDDVMRWSSLNGLRDVSAFQGEEGMMDYFYVKARTP